MKCWLGPRIKHEMKLTFMKQAFSHIGEWVKQMSTKEAKNLEHHDEILKFNILYHWWFWKDQIQWGKTKETQELKSGGYMVEFRVEHTDVTSWGGGLRIWNTAEGWAKSRERGTRKVEMMMTSMMIVNNKFWALINTSGML